MPRSAHQTEGSCYAGTMQIIIAFLLGIMEPTWTDEQAARGAELFEATAKLPDIEPNLILPTVRGALVAETERWTAPLLVSIAWGESRFESWNKTVSSASSLGHVCGPMQTMPQRAGDCALWADPVEGFRAGVAELDEWARDKRTRGAVWWVLLGQACGNSAFDGTCSKTWWPSWVIERAKRLGYVPARPAS